MFKTLLSLSLITLFVNPVYAYTIPTKSDSFGQLVEYAVSAIQNDAHFDSICSSNKCKKTWSWGYWYQTNIYGNSVDLFFDLTGHLVEVRKSEIPINLRGQVNSSLHAILSNNKNSFEVPYDYLNKRPTYPKIINRYFIDNAEVILTEQGKDRFTLSIQTSYENSRKRVEKLMGTDKNLQLHVKLGHNRNAVDIVPGISRIKDLGIPFDYESPNYGEPEFKNVPILVNGAIYILKTPYDSDLILAINKRVYTDDDPSEKLSKQEDMLRVFNDTVETNENLLKVDGISMLGTTYYCINGSTGLSCIKKYQEEKHQFPDSIQIDAPETIQKNEKFIFNREKFLKLIQRANKEAEIPTDNNGFLRYPKQ